MRLPPADISPRGLFTSLLPLRPTVAIAGLPGLPPMRIQALGARTLDRILDLTEDQDVELVAAALGRPVEALGNLFLPEVRELAHQTRKGLQGFPAYGYSDIDKWTGALAEGAKGTIEGHALGSCCVDHTCERPDRFWGVPLHELLDCHWIVFRAARRNYKDSK